MVPFDKKRRGDTRLPPFSSLFDNPDLLEFIAVKGKTK
jgi:hypothetical protein